MSRISGREMRRHSFVIPVMNAGAMRTANAMRTGEVIIPGANGEVNVLRIAINAPTW